MYVQKCSIMYLCLLSVCICVCVCVFFLNRRNVRLGMHHNVFVSTLCMYLCVCFFLNRRNVHLGMHHNAFVSALCMCLCTCVCICICFLMYKCTVFRFTKMYFKKLQENIILKLISMHQEVNSINGFIWLKIGTNWGLFWME